MSREEALQKLEALRSQLITVYTCSETCEQEKNRLDALTDEQKNPAPLSFVPEATDEEATLRAEFEQKNSRKIKKGWGVEALIVLVFALVLAGIVAAMYFDITAGTGILISPELLKKSGGDEMSALALQGLVSVAVVVVSIISLVMAKE